MAKKSRKHPKARKGRKSRTATSSFRRRHYWGRDRSGRKRWLLKKAKKVARTAKRKHADKAICTRCGHTRRAHYTIGRSDGRRYKKLKHAFTQKRNAKKKDAEARKRRSKARKATNARSQAHWKRTYTPPTGSTGFRGFDYEREARERAAHKERQQRAWDEANARAARDEKAYSERAYRNDTMGANCDEMKRNWRKQMIEHHPDKFQGEEAKRQEKITQSINEEYQRARKRAGC